MLKKILLCFLLLIFSNHLFAIHKKTKYGKIEDDQYFSKNPPFSISLPCLITTLMKVRHVVDHGCAEVIIINDFGVLFQIVTPIEKMSVPNENESEFYSLFRNAIMLSLLKNTPKASVIHEEKLTLAQKQEALFLLVDLPEGSHLMDAITKQRSHAVKGFLIFCKDSQQVTLGFENDLIVQREEISFEELKEHYKKYLLESANSYKVLNVQQAMKN